MKYFTILLLAITLTSCASNPDTNVGAKILQTPRYLIANRGGFVGAGLLGATLDEQDRKVMEQNSPRTVDRIDRGEPLTINDVIKLSQAGVSDDAILRYMRETGSYYALSQPQVRRLKDSGVSQRVINDMLDSGR